MAFLLAGMAAVAVSVAFWTAIIVTIGRLIK
jgi:hypothetical protein